MARNENNKGTETDDEHLAFVHPEIVIPVADLVDLPATEIVPIPISAPVRATLVGRSWVFRAVDGVSFLISRLFGICSIIFLTAATANVPIIQFASLGYLLETSGRIARGGKWSSGLVGLEKATRIGSMFLGTWLLLLPIRFFSDQFWYESYLIDPDSPQTRSLRVIQIILIVLAILQIVAAWACGGRLRYFFWQLFAPFSFVAWGMRKLGNSSALRPTLNLFLGWLSPHFVDDLCRSPSPTDWFVPAILWRKIRTGTLYSSARDGVWDFLMGLNFPYYFFQGLKGGAGTLIWLIPPTALMLVTTQTGVGSVAGICGLVGSLIAIPVFAVLPLLQTHFAVGGKFSSFFEIGKVAGLIRRAPFAYLVSLFLTLLFAIPLFLLKIEEIPTELLWTLSIVFIAFTWPARMCVGLAYRRADSAESNGRWWVRYPIMSLTLPVSLAFVAIFFFTTYVTWHGGISLFENHVFLLPAPFWL